MEKAKSQQLDNQSDRNVHVKTNEVLQIYALAAKDCGGCSLFSFAQRSM